MFDKLHCFTTSSFRLLISNYKFVGHLPGQGVSDYTRDCTFNFSKVSGNRQKGFLWKYFLLLFFLMIYKSYTQNLKYFPSNKYPNVPRIVTYVRKRLTFFRLLSRLNELDLSGLFFTEYWHDLDNYFVKKKVHTSPARLGVRAIWKKWLVFWHVTIRGSLG